MGARVVLGSALLEILALPGLFHQRLRILRHVANGNLFTMTLFSFLKTWCKSWTFGNFVRKVGYSQQLFDLLQVLMTAECYIHVFFPGQSKAICNKQNLSRSYLLIGVVGLILALIYPLNRNVSLMKNCNSLRIAIVASHCKLFFNFCFLAYLWNMSLTLTKVNFQIFATNFANCGIVIVVQKRV